MIRPQAFCANFAIRGPDLKAGWQNWDRTVLVFAQRSFENGPTLLEILVSACRVPPLPCSTGLTWRGSHCL